MPGVSDLATRRFPEGSRSPASRRRAVAAGLFLLLCPCLGTVSLNSLPDSVRPCLPCHNREESDQVREWLASPYSQAKGGRTCPDCHGPRCSGNGDPRSRSGTIAAPPRRPATSERLKVTAVCSSSGVDAEVVVTNLGSGHDLPTGPPARTLVMEVTAQTQDGLPLPPRARSGLPVLAVGSTATPRRIFVKDPAGRSPETYRSRLAPFETDVSRYRFVSPGRGPARVKARLVLYPVTGIPLEIASAESVCSPSSEKAEAAP
jgi:hypothetical protein